MSYGLNAGGEKGEVRGGRKVSASDTVDTALRWRGSRSAPSWRGSDTVSLLAGAGSGLALAVSEARAGSGLALSEAANSWEMMEGGPEAPSVLPSEVTVICEKLASILDSDFNVELRF